MIKIGNIIWMLTSKEGRAMKQQTMKNPLGFKGASFEITAVGEELNSCNSTLKLDIRGVYQWPSGEKKETRLGTAKQGLEEGGKWVWKFLDLPVYGERDREAQERVAEIVSSVIVEVWTGSSIKEFETGPDGCIMWACQSQNEPSLQPTQT